MAERKIKFIGLTKRSIVVGLIWMVAFTLLIPYLNFLSPWTKRKKEWPHTLLDPGAPGYCYRNFWYTNFIFALYPILVNKVMPKKLKLKSSELAFVCSMLLPLIGIIGMPGVGATLTTIRGGLISPATMDFVRDYASPLLGPMDLNVYAGIETGGAVVPWAEWTVPVVWYTVFYMSFFAYMLFISGLLRRLWVNDEFLPYPLATVQSTLVKEAAADTQGEGMFKSGWLWVGFLYCIIFYFGQYNDYIFGFGSFPTAMDFTKVAGLTGVFLFIVNPWALGLGLFMPDNVLVTTFVSYILMYMVLPWALWVPLGLIEALPPGRPTWWTFNRFIGKFEFYTPTALRGGYMGFAYGILLGLAIYPLLFHRNYFKTISKGILGQKVAWEDEEPLPYRYLWWGTFASAIIFLATTSAANLPIHYGIVTLFFVTLFHLGTGRLQAETSWGTSLLGGWGEFLSQPYEWMMWPLGLTNLPSEGTAYMFTTHILVSNSGWGVQGIGMSNPIGFSQEAYKLGYETGAKSKNQFISQFMTYIIATIIGIPFFLWLYYNYGIVQGVSTSNNLPWMLAMRPIVDDTPYNPVWTPNASLIGNYIWGVVFVFLMYLLRAKVGGIFNYASAAAILITTTQGLNVWLAWLIAFLVKLVVRRVGGTQLVRKITVPLAVGLLLAGAFFIPIALSAQWFRAVSAI